MSKRISFVLGFLLVLTANIFASPKIPKDFKGTTKKEALVYIEKALNDPGIKKWVEHKFSSEKLFKHALKSAPEKATLKIATKFSEFQKVGGQWDLFFIPLQIDLFDNFPEWYVKTLLWIFGVLLALTLLVGLL